MINITGDVTPVTPVTYPDRDIGTAVEHTADREGNRRRRRVVRIGSNGNGDGCTREGTGVDTFDGDDT